MLSKHCCLIEWPIKSTLEPWCEFTGQLVIKKNDKKKVPQVERTPHISTKPRESDKRRSQ